MPELINNTKSSVTTSVCKRRGRYDDDDDDVHFQAVYMEIKATPWISTSYLQLQTTRSAVHKKETGTYFNVENTVIPCLNYDRLWYGEYFSADHQTAY